MLQKYADNYFRDVKEMLRLPKSIWIPLFCLPMVTSLYGQTPEKGLYIARATDKIKIDGEIGEQSWQQAAIATNFTQNFPFDSSLALSKTEVMATFDESNIYFAAICYQSKKYIVRSLKRDFENGSTDLVFFNINPFRDKLNGFYFAVSPYGVQKEGLIANGDELTLDWDNKWRTAVNNYADKWVVEIAIPFKTLRYKLQAGANSWDINFGRNDLVRNERSSWAPVPRGFRLIDINFTRPLLWKEPPPAAGPNVSIIPFALNETSKDYVSNTPVKNQLAAGLDAKISITPSLNLDLTINPDFAQVEVDRQVTDLSRFELFFPERRQFFIENSDLFGTFGATSINPFFSRRIGLINNSTTGLNEKIPIYGGARLSGRINKDWRIGLLNMQTKAFEADSLPSVNYLVAAVQRRVFTRSSIGVIAVNKVGFVNKRTKADFTKFNRVVGVDYNLASKNSFWQGKIFYHRSFLPINKAGSYASGIIINHQRPTLNIESNLYNVGTGYTAEAGFLPRNGFVRQSSNISFIFFPRGRINKRINSFRVTPDYDVIYSKFDKRITDLDAGLFWGVRLQNSAELNGAAIRFDYTYLFEDFDPTNKYDSGVQVLKAGTAYRYFSNRFSFLSNNRRNFFYLLQGRGGQYFNGSIVSLQTEWNYRWQPYGIFGIAANYNRIRLPKGYNNADFLLIGPRVELSFTRSIFWTNFIQYNNQTNNINVNSRFQWRFKPLSDLFIVYTDNYFAQEENDAGIKTFGKKNRALVIKMNYWLNL
jgi:hypothetical protein